MGAWQRTPQDDRLLAALRAARRDPDPITMAVLERLQRETQDRPRRNVESPYEVTAGRMFPTAAQEDVAALTGFLRRRMGAQRAAGPVLVPLPASATQLAAGDECSFALLADGTVWTWGMDLRSPDFSEFTRDPVQVAGLPRVAWLTAGGETAIVSLAP